MYPAEPSSNSSDPAVWLRQLQDEQPARRAEAARRLGELKARQAVEALCQALKDPRSEVQAAAARALGEIGAVDAMDALVEATQSNSRYVRMVAAEALARLGWRPPDFSLSQDFEFEEPLDDMDMKAIGDFALVLDETEVYLAAFATLKQIGTPEVIPPLLRLLASYIERSKWLDSSESQARSFFFSEPEAIEAVERIEERFGEQVIAPLLPFLSHPEVAVRRVAISILSRFEDARLVEPFITALNDEDSTVRQKAVRWLGKLGGSRAVEALKARLMDESEEVRLAALEVLAPLAPAETLEGAKSLLSSRFPQTRHAAVRVLCSLDTPLVVPTLLTLLEEEEPEIRLMAIQAIQKFREPRATDALVRNLQHWEKEIRNAACDALEALDWSPQDETQRFWYSVARQDRQQIQALAQVAIDQVSLRLGEKDPRNFQAIAEALLALGEAAVDPLIIALQNPYLRFQAIRLLGQIRSRRALPALIALLEEEERRPYRQEIVATLVLIGDSAAIPVLISLLHDRDKEVAKTAAHWLVAWYQQGNLPDEMRQAILNRREEITYHHDGIGRNEFGCRLHEDEGLGVLFPL